MTTIARSRQHTHSIAGSVYLAGRYNLLIRKLEFSYFGFIAMALLIGSCLGGITTMKIFENAGPFWEFLLSLGITMANLVACISQAPVKWVVNLFAAGLLVNTFLLMLNLV